MRTGRFSGMIGTLIISFIGALGCGVNHTPPAAIDVGAARQSLDRVLTAWKEQAKPDSLLQDSKAPVHVADEDWIMGYQLKSFELAPGEPTPITAARVRFEVKLDLTSPQGKNVQRKVLYSVSTSPSISVIREEPGA
jgi:hypothetical protein